MSSLTKRTPGVYIEEIPLFPPSIAAVETAIPAFIGFTQKAERDGKSIVLEPTRITSLLEYRNYFGVALPETTITVEVGDQTDSSDKLLSRQVTASIGAPSPHIMFYALQAFYANGGGPCYVVSVGTMKEAGGVIAAEGPPPPGDTSSGDTSSGDTSSGDASAGDTSSGDASAGDASAGKKKYGIVDGINAVEAIDEVTLLVIPELQHSEDYNDIATAALSQCGKLQDRFTILDIPMPVGEETILKAAGTFRSYSLPLDNLKYGAAYTPNVMATFNYQFEDSGVTVNQKVTKKIEGGAEVTDSSFTLDTVKPGEGDTVDAALYNLALATINSLEMELPLSPFIAGVYASVDRTRGVWKAPANVALANVSRPARRITNGDQDGLNMDPSGKSINAIRAFTGKGTLVWGARTLAGNDNEWRYISVRRFFNMVEESTKKATEQFVFEPNNANTWVKVKAMIENFLVNQWRAGALVGAKQEHAFYVKVGLNETMTAEDILNGYMIVEIGMAVVRPAEFIILRFSHKMQES